MVNFLLQDIPKSVNDGLWITGQVEEFNTRSTNTQIHKYTNTQLHKYTNIQPEWTTGVAQYSWKQSIIDNTVLKLNLSP